jgi:hypothetical protein
MPEQASGPVVDRRDDLPWSDALPCPASARTAYEKDDVELIRLDVLDPHRGYQCRPQALHVLLLVCDLARVVVVVTQVEAQRINCRSHATRTCNCNVESGYLR